MELHLVTGRTSSLSHSRLPRHSFLLILPGIPVLINLAEILHSVKRHSARVINQLRGTQGSLWQDERYDRIVRDEAEFLEKWNYIRNNPVKSGLADSPEEYPWLYERGVVSTFLCKIFKEWQGQASSANGVAFPF